MNGDGGNKEVTKTWRAKSRSRKPKSMAEKVEWEKEDMEGNNDMQKAELADFYFYFSSEFPSSVHSGLYFTIIPVETQSKASCSSPASYITITAMGIIHLETIIGES